MVAKVFAQPFLPAPRRTRRRNWLFAFLGLVVGIDHIGHRIGALRWRVVLVVLGQVFEHGQNPLLMLPSRMARTSWLSCSSSRLTLSGRSLESDHTLTKLQVAGHQRLGVVHDEDARRTGCTGNLLSRFPTRSPVPPGAERLRALGAAPRPVIAPRSWVSWSWLMGLVEVWYCASDVLLRAHPRGAADRRPLARLDHGAGLAATVFVRWIDQLAVLPLFLSIRMGRLMWSEYLAMTLLRLPC